MKFNSLIVRILCASILLVAGAQIIVAQPKAGQQPSVSPAEQAMAEKIRSAPDVPARLTAGEEFIKKYPKSVLRPRITAGLVDQIGGVTDTNQRLLLAERLQKSFAEPSDQQMITPLLLDSLVAVNRVDEAFAMGTTFISQNPDALLVLVSLTSVGMNQVKQKNGKFIDQSLKFGAHAIELIEADKKPADFDAEAWKQYRATTLPSVYQTVGALYLTKGDISAAKTQITKASELAPSDPFNQLMLAGFVHQEYQQGAKQVQAMPAGPARDEERKKVLVLLDKVIDAYAHFLGLSEGNASLQAVRTEYLGDLESYYKYRHNGSTEGMQQLIDKYKGPVKMPLP